MSDAEKPLEVFYSYAHEDEDLRDKLEKHLSILRTNGVISNWHDRNISAGTEWEHEIDEHLNSADIILLLISSDFLASRYCSSVELKRAMERHEARKASVIPIIIRSVYWKGAIFGKLNFLPTDGKPVRSWPDIDEAFTNVAQGIAKVAEALRRSRQSGSATRSSTTPPLPPRPALPRVWTVPHSRNLNFTGREELLQDLLEKLTSGQHAALTQPQALHGLGGVGKTQLANEYAYRYAGEYDAVLWVRAEEPTTLAADFAALAGELGISQLDTRDQDADVKAVLRWLRENTRWLLVFDNAEDGKQIAKYLPQVGTGHVLITSRNPNWRQYAQPVVVEVLEPEEAVDFLLKRTGEKDRATAGKLAEGLGFLPIALAQAGAYMEQKQKSLADYLPLFQEYRDKAFIPSDDYPATIAATWELTFQAVRGHSPAAADLLNLCAFFAPEDIPLDMIVAGADHLPESLKKAVSEPLKLDDVVGELGKYSLVEVDKDRRSISIHRLVQAVVRDKLSPDARQTWIEAALRVVGDGFSYRIDGMGTWPIAASVLPHALAVISFFDLQIPTTKGIGELLSHVLNEVGLYLEHRAQYKEARDQLERAIVIGEAVYGPDHPTVAIRLNNLGTVLRVLGDLQGARSNHERALAIGKSMYGPDHPTVAARLNNLGTVLRELGDLQGARSNFERALAIIKSVHGPDHPHVAVGLNNLGAILRALGDLQGARSNLERALAIDKSVYGPNHPNVAVRLSMLGTVLRELGDLQGARSNFERAFAIGEAVYGPDHPEAATWLANLGVALLEGGNFQEAQGCLTSAYRTFHKYLGPEHPKTTTAGKWLEDAIRLSSQNTS
ncbi:MAG TPA: FxSxx-COOH system tetratricopeptide repeat protein [Chloroflexia bacterium]|jgi:tetratricopeptide (TPR) repeat protein